ncbi:uncharacterized protein [Antedon mediterranea]|uniref:uncharacterized protein n=1 Tax=Antedon mediterranea TaxID=105859 RepID=UPI003AF52F91
MSSKYYKNVYKDLEGDDGPVDFDFFDDDDASDKREHQLNKQPLLTSTPGKEETLASTSYSPRSTDLESARSATSSRSSLNVRLPSVSPSVDDVVSSEESDDETDRSYNRNNLKQTNRDRQIPDSNKSVKEPIKRIERPKTCKPGSRSRQPETNTKTDDHSSSDSGSYSSSFTSGSSSSSGNSSSSGTDDDSDSGSVTDVSPLQSPNSTNTLNKTFSCSDEELPQERPKTSKVNSRQRHIDGNAKKSKKESVRFAGVKKSNGHKSAPGSRWNESEAQELSMLLKAVLEMEEAPKTLVQMPGKQRSRPTSAKSTTSNASTKSLPHKRMNMSFSNDRVRQIDRENQRLLKQIMSKSGVNLGNEKARVMKPKKVVGSHINTNGTHRPVLSHAAMRRQREHRRIEIENMQILKRIESAKPTRDITKDALLEDHYRMTQYAQQVSRSPMRPTSAKSASGKTMSDAGSLLSLYSNDSVSSKTGSSSSSRPTSAKKTSFRPSTGRRPKQAWDDHWQS